MQWSRWLAVALLLLATTPAQLPAHATTSGANGMLLVHISRGGLGLTPVTGGPVTRITTDYTHDARMAPDGASVAYLARSAKSNSEDVRVHRADGSDVQVTSIANGAVQELTWSPDGKRLAFLVRELDGHQVTGVKSIYTVPVSGGTATSIMTTASSDWPGWEPSLDWHPSRDLIAFTFGRDIWTMDSSGKQLSQWTRNCAYPRGLDTTYRGDLNECRGQSPNSYAGQKVRWQPTGDRLAVSIYDCNEDAPCSWSLGSLQLGSAKPTKVAAWPPVTSDQIVGNRPVVPAPDGKSYAFSDGLNVALISLKGAIETTSVHGPLYDWQACGPKGCPVFKAVGKPTSITAVSTLSGHCTPSGCVADNLVATGRLTPALTKPPVAVRLEVFKGASWSVVAVRSASLSKTGNYRSEFTIPRGATKCRITASFSGDDTYSSSSVTKAYLC